jgi:CHAD domain-containing protein
MVGTNPIAIGVPAQPNPLVADLSTERYGALIDRWTSFLADPPATTADEVEGDQPAPVVAAERIGRAHRRMVKRGRRITADSEPERLHDLRKDAKRLRYLLECFGSLFPPAQVTPIVKDLKGVQEVLGTYQDCQVQAGQLEQFAQEMIDRDDVAASSVMVIGLLVEQLDRRAELARAHFAERFAAFDRPATRDAVRGLAVDAGDPEPDGPAAPDGSAGAVPRTPQEPAP